MKRFLLVFAIFTTLAFLASMRTLAFLEFAGRSSHWTRIYLEPFVYWYYWALTVPIAAWITKKYTFKTLGKTLFIIILFSVVIILLNIFVYSCISLITPDRIFKGKSLAERFMMSLFFHRNYWEILIFWSFLAILYSWRNYKKLTEREIHSSNLETQLAQAQLSTLKMQLQPHFLFNTLNTIATLLREKADYNQLKENAAAADRMITNLSEMFRHTLKMAELHEILLREELSFLNNYLAIQKIRFPDRLEVEMRIEPNLDTVLVPAFFLQPIVENAIRHGISRLTKQGKLFICINQKNDREIEFIIRDNGPCTEEELKRESSDGIGLSNIRKRLHYLYGDSYQFEITKNKNRETEVKITIPYH